MAKFKSDTQRKEFEAWLKEQATAILLCANLSHYLLRAINSVPSMPSAEMAIETDTKYLEVTLTYSEDHCSADWYAKELDDTLMVLCHEIAHIPTTEFINGLHIDNNAKTITYHDERLTEHVSRWLHKAYLAQTNES